MRDPDLGEHGEHAAPIRKPAAPGPCVRRSPAVRSRRGRPRGTRRRGHSPRPASPAGRSGGAGHSDRRQRVHYGRGGRDQGLRMRLRLHMRRRRELLQYLRKGRGAREGCELRELRCVGGRPGAGSAAALDKGVLHGATRARAGGVPFLAGVGCLSDQR